MIVDFKAKLTATYEASHMHEWSKHAYDNSPPLPRLATRSSSPATRSSSPATRSSSPATRKERAAPAERAAKASRRADRAAARAVRCPAPGVYNPTHRQHHYNPNGFHQPSSTAPSFLTRAQLVHQTSAAAGRRSNSQAASAPGADDQRRRRGSIEGGRAWTRSRFISDC
jgi:hypothetical protein